MGPLKFCVQGALHTLYLNGEPRTCRCAYCEWLICLCACLLSHRTSFKKFKLKGKRILVWKLQSKKPSQYPSEHEALCSYIAHMLMKLSLVKNEQ